MDPIAVTETSAATQRILVVDDEEGAVETLGFILESEGFVVTPALSGTAAMAALRLDSFEVILLDIVMPDADGLVLCREIRTLYPRTPVILMTGYYAENVFDDVQTMPGVFLLNKPLPIMSLLDMCRELCANGIAGQPETLTSGVSA
ncbi:MAG: response regulator [Candidatus Sericytochromatia bacterium]|nr:response regulator [Candidatus Sericytochromatia bacterium]